MLKQMKKEWANIGEGFSCKFLSANNDLVSKDNITRSKLTSDKIKEVLEIHRQISSDKKSTILSSKQDYWEILRNKSAFSKQEFEERVRVLNSLHSVMYFLEK